MYVGEFHVDIWIFGCRAGLGVARTAAVVVSGNERTTSGRSIHGARSNVPPVRSAAGLVCRYHSEERLVRVGSGSCSLAPDSLLAFSLSSLCDFLAQLS